MHYGEFVVGRREKGFGQRPSMELADAPLMVDKA